MGHKSKVEINDQIRSELSKESNDEVLYEPYIKYNESGFRLNLILKSDYIFLTKIFADIENRLNEKIDFDKLKKEAEQEVLEVQKQMVKIQAKKIISVREFTEIYGDSKTTQQNYRGRMHDPLPYEQKVEGGKVTYIVEKVEQWKANQYK
jgi:hypothetical protein